MPDQKEYNLGAPFVAYGDPTTAGGMIDLGQVPSATITIESMRASASDVGGFQVADSLVDRGAKMDAQIELYDAQAGVLAALLGSALEGSGGELLLNAAPRRITPKTLVVIPNGKEVDAINKVCYWMPAADDSGSIDLSMTDADGEDANESYNVDFSGMKALEDLAGTAIPEGYQTGFKGVPDASLSWQLPDRYKVAATAA